MEMQKIRESLLFYNVSFCRIKNYSSGTAVL